MAPRSDFPSAWHECRAGYQWYVCSRPAGIIQYSGCCSVDACFVGNYCPVLNQEVITVTVQTTSSTAAPAGVPPPSGNVVQSTTTVQASPAGPVTPVVSIIDAGTVGTHADNTAQATVDHSSPSVGVIVAAAVGSIVGVAILVGLWVWLCCVRRRHEGDNVWPLSRPPPVGYPPSEYVGGDSFPPCSPPPTTPVLAPYPVPISNQLGPSQAQPQTSQKFQPDDSGNPEYLKNKSSLNLLDPKMMQTLDVRLTALGISSTTALLKAELLSPIKPTSSSPRRYNTGSGTRPRVTSRSRQDHSPSYTDFWKPDLRSPRPRHRTGGETRSRSHVRRSHSTPAQAHDHPTTTPRRTYRSNSDSHTLVNDTSTTTDTNHGRAKYTTPSHPTLSIRRDLRNKGFLPTARSDYFWHPKKGVETKVTSGALTRVHGLSRMGFPHVRSGGGGGTGGGSRTWMDSDVQSSASEATPVDRWARSRGLRRADGRHVWFDPRTGRFVDSSRFAGREEGRVGA